MNIVKNAVLVTLLICSFASLGMEPETLKLSTIKTEHLTEDFFFELFRGGELSNRNNTKVLITFGQKEFHIVRPKTKFKKTCTTKHQKVRNAYFSPAGQHIITTSLSANNVIVVDIWDYDCTLLFSFTDPVEGIHLGIFGRNDYEIIINSKEDSNRSKLIKLAPKTVLARENLKMKTYIEVVRQYIISLGQNEASYDNFVDFISRISKNNDAKHDEKIIFYSLDDITQRYLRHLIPGRNYKITQKNIDKVFNEVYGITKKYQSEKLSSELIHPNVLSEFIDMELSVDEWSLEIEKTYSKVLYSLWQTIPPEIKDHILDAAVSALD